MFHFNVPRENLYLMCSGGTEVKHWFKIEESKAFFCFCSRFQKTPIESSGKRILASLPVTDYF